MTTKDGRVTPPINGDTQELDRVTIRFAGDSGDGSQVAGLQFTNTAALIGNDISTVPDFPAEIRAPAGSLPGVSSFQVSFSSYDIHTPGDAPDVLVAMNPAALKTNLPDLPKGGTIIVNTDEFTDANLRKAGYQANPLEDGTLSAYRVIEVPITSMNARALKDSGLNTKQIDRSKNFFALGLMFWLYERPLDPTLRWIEQKFSKNPAVTPASDILQELARFKNFGVKTFQAEDEISAIGSAIGAAFGGCLGLTGTSGPGLALKSESLGLAVMVELPIVVAMIQRSGPSTGMPTKTEQADLLQAMFGRNGECPVAIVAPATPAECFDIAIEAFRIALRHMVPTIFVSDGYLGTSSEPWRLPSVADLPTMRVDFATDPSTFHPYSRDPETLARPWAVPGTPGLEHRIGGLEKADVTGNVSYDAENHDRMVRFRAEKVARIANDIPDVKLIGDEEGSLLVLGWGSTYGPALSAVQRARARGLSVSHAHLRYLNPFPANLGDVLSRFDRVLIPEMNLGQLLMLIRARYLVDAAGLNQVTGRPFKIAQIEEKINQLVRSKVTIG